jgi:malate synthase
MEDAATAEISRAQIWQWIQHGAHLDDGRPVTPALFKSVLEDEMTALERTLPGYAAGAFSKAIEIFSAMSLAERFEEFLTLPAYGALQG